MHLIDFLFVTGAFSLSIGASKITSGDSGTNEHELQEDVNDLLANEKDWPWIAAIYHVSNENSRTLLCSGALIHPRTVLTSATCVLKDGQQIVPQRMQVELGKYNSKEIESNVQEFEVHQIIPHSFFDASSRVQNNIAIIRLSHEATLSDYVQPIRISSKSSRLESPEMINELGTVVGLGIWHTATEQLTEEVTIQNALMPVERSVRCLSGSQQETVLPDGCYCAAYQDGMKFGYADYAAMMTFKENGVYTIRGIVSKVLSNDGHSDSDSLAEYVIFTDVPQFAVWMKEVAPELDNSKSANDSASEFATVCRPTEEFVIEPYRCDETCEKFGDPICVEYTPEGRCYCKEGFVRLTTVDICVTADNRACRAKMPPTNETCERRQNEHLSEWLHDEPCANTCENYNVPCNVSAPTGMFWGPHCVCKDGFARLPNGKCVAIDDPECREFWSPTITISTTPQTTTSTTVRTTTTPALTPCKDFCGRNAGSSYNCPQFDVGMQWSSSGSISGKHCTRVIESADPHTWSDNYICFNSDYGVRWSSAGTIGGMKCTQLLEAADPHTWHDNFLCVPNDAQFRFQWSSNGLITGLCCEQIAEAADPHTWLDNYLCVSVA